MVQKMNYFFIRHLARELIDVISAIDELPDFAPHIAQTRFGGYDTFQTFCHCRGVAHVRNSMFWVVFM
jgi:hypothetical protein